MLLTTKYTIIVETSNNAGLPPIRNILIPQTASHIRAYFFALATCFSVAINYKV